VRGIRFVRLAAAAAVVSAGLAVTVAPVSAATPIRVTTNYMGADVTYDYTAPGQTGSAWIWVQLTDEYAGTGWMEFSQSIEGVDADGNWTGPILWSNGSGEVQVEIDEHLRTAHVWGWLTIWTCDYIANPNCGNPVPHQAYVDATWTATTGARRTHSVMVGSVSRTSRTIFHVGATQAFADAVVLVDGVSLGETASQSAGDIFDARYSTAEMYFGGELPGTVKNVPNGVGTGGHRAVPSPHGGPTEWPFGTQFVAVTDRVEASWYQNDGGADVWQSFSAVYETLKQRNLTTVRNEAYYYAEVYGSGGLVQSIEATGSGDLGVAGSLSHGSFSGTLIATVCSSLSPWQQVCLDGVELPVNLAWTASGPVERTMSNQHGDDATGGKLVWQYQNDQCPAVATGTIGDEVMPGSESGILGRERNRSDIFI
jgi:hypothetical protein